MGKKRHFKGNNSSEDRKRRKEAAEKWKNTRGDENQRNDGWNTITDNARFRAFYKAQHFVDEGEDWSRFVESLRAPLPACFRINPDYTFAQDLREQLLSFMGEKLIVDGVEIEAVEQMPWYPNQFGYKLGTDRRSIRKLPALNQLHKWMIQHTANGNITRQEAVSMVPPIALDVHPHHKCLDMCAAPGSKTSQLLEIVNRSIESPLDQQGLVVANDADTDRAYMLVHQCKRINSPLLVVTTHKGQNFPTIHDLDANTGRSEYFDRVLCDVPCSGDGTLRKNPAIWGRWNVAMATSLYPLQLMIANRG
jgi:16S rRNA C967 or C1407 C5-methylase (RsmB/RsmF family)